MGHGDADRGQHGSVGDEDVYTHGQSVDDSGASEVYDDRNVRDDALMSVDDNTGGFEHDEGENEVPPSSQQSKEVSDDEAF